MRLRILQKRKIWFTISGILFLASILFWIAWGLKLGIDFTGGSLLEIEYSQERPDLETIQLTLDPLELESLNIQPAGEQGYIFRFAEVNQEKHQEILDTLEQAIAPEEESTEENSEGELTIEPSGESSADLGVQIIGVETGSDEPAQNTVIEKRFDSIGPIIGKELRTKSLYLIVVVIIAIILFVAYAFRKVSYPISSWHYGLMAIFALIHDIVITVGVFVILGHFLGWEIGVSFVAALLTILGYSVNDTIVVFDRIRENLHRFEGDFLEIIEKSVNETVTRSINTSFTTLLVLVVIFIFGGATLQVFIMTLIIGILLGTYSSIFVASPMLYVWAKLLKKIKS